MNDNTESLVSEVVALCRALLPAEDVEAAADLNAHGEPKAALELLCDQIQDFGLVPSEVLQSKILVLGRALDVGWDRLTWSESGVLNSGSPEGLVDELETLRSELRLRAVSARDAGSTLKSRFGPLVAIRVLRGDFGLSFDDAKRIVRDVE